MLTTEYFEPKDDKQDDLILALENLDTYFGLEYLGHGIDDRNEFYVGFSFMGIDFYMDLNGREIICN